MSSGCCKIQTGCCVAGPPGLQGPPGTPGSSFIPLSSGPLATPMTLIATLPTNLTAGVAMTYGDNAPIVLNDTTINATNAVDAVGMSFTAPVALSLTNLSAGFLVTAPVQLPVPVTIRADIWTSSGPTIPYTRQTAAGIPVLVLPAGAVAAGTFASVNVALAPTIAVALGTRVLVTYEAVGTAATDPIPNIIGVATAGLKYI